MKKALIVCLTIVGACLGSCNTVSPHPTITPTHMGTDAVSPTSFIATATQGIAATPTFFTAPTATDAPIPTATFSPTPPITATSIPGYQRICPNVDETLLSELNASGYLLRAPTDGDNFLYALDVSTGDLITLLPGTYSGQFIVSPDGKWLAHKMENADGQLGYEVRQISGPPILFIPYDDNWSYITSWLDNERLVVSYWRGTGDDWASNYGNAIINVFTGQTIEIDGDRLEGFGNPGIDPLYDLSRTRVIYTRYEPLGDVYLVLWDLETGQFLWEMNISDQFWNLRPAWSPDGTQFAVGGPPDLFAYNITFELFLVDRDGQATQLTHFAEAGLREVRITRPQWSPDGHYIAFWLSESLAVYDTVTGMISDYCFLASYTDEHYIYWSPDSRQIAANSGLHEDPWGGPERVIVIDVVSNKAIEATRDYSVIGWMVEEP